MLRPDEMTAVPLIATSITPCHTRLTAAETTIDTLRIPDIIRTGLWRWRLIAMTAGLGCLCGILAFSLQMPLFRARTAIEIQNLNLDFLDMRQAKPLEYRSDGPYGLFDFKTHVELLESEQVADKTKRAMIQNGIRSEWLAKPTAWERLTRTKHQPASADTLLDAIAESVNAREVTDTRIIEVQVDAPDPFLAADFANTLISQYRDQTNDVRRQITDAAQVATLGQLSALREKLAASQKQLSDYAKEHHVVFTPERLSIADDKLQQTQSDLLDARKDRIEKQVRSDLMAQPADSFPALAEDAELRDLRPKLLELQRTEAALLAVFRPDYSEVQKVLAQEKTIQTAMERERKQILSKIRDDYKQSIEREKMLSAANTEEVRQAAATSKMAVQYDILRREVASNLRGYQDVLVKAMELSVSASIPMSSVRIVDPATPPEHRNSPKLAVNAVLGLFAGLVLSLGFAVVQERSDERLRNTRDVLEFGVPVLAAIPPAIEKLESRISQAAFLMPPTTEERDFEVEYPATTNSIRTLMTSILLSDAGGKPPKSIVVASCLPGEGKTIVASHLAVALARGGRRVLLIDGNLRTPQIHKLFGLPNMAGLGNILDGSRDFSELGDLVHSIMAGRLNILPSGTFATTAPDLLFNPRLGDLLATLQEEFEIVVIDSSALQRVPDARLTALYASGIILVARTRHSNRRSIRRICDRLKLDGSTVLGLVLNDWNDEASLYS